MEKDEELYAAATILDGYLKANRQFIDTFTQESLYIGIREIVNNMSAAYKEEKSEVIKILISTKEDWNRFQSIPKNLD